MISLDLAADDTHQGGQIRAAQIGAILRLTPLAMAASCLDAVIVTTTLWSVRPLRLKLLVWAALILLMALNYIRGWAFGRARPPGRPASRRAMRRAVWHAVLFGALWAAVPVMTLGQALSVQLLVGSLSAGMMCAGAFVLATVPMAGLAFVAMLLVGDYYALVYAGLSTVNLGLTALLTVYAASITINLTWNAQLFVEHFLTEARLTDEIMARERAQTQVAHAQRMTALGELAGGIAHDFNNILQSVSGNANLIAARFQDLAQTRRLAGAILEAAERGGAISRRLLVFARQDVLSADPIDPGEFLGGAPDLLRHALDPGIVLRIEVPPGLRPLLADRTQLESILVNLASNASGAMPGGGVLTVSADAETLAAAREAPPLAPGDYIRLRIADTGCGMDAATLVRAAEPFFTTKPKGKGTGLGLSMAKGFAEQSGGGFAIASTLGRGTTVTLWLPQASIAAQPRPIWPDAPLRLAPASRPCRILFVDDDVNVREAIAWSLEDAGFAVLGAAGGEAALAELDSGTAVDALVSDFLMPGMNGVELIRAARLRRPGLPAMLLTGHVGDIGKMTGLATEGGRYVLLQKPIRPTELTRRLAALLETQAGS